DILEDVYFVDARPSEETTLSVDYFATKISSNDVAYPLMVAVAYSSFATMLWLQKHLAERSRALESGLIGVTALADETAAELKLLRIFCLRFISESRPISVRLTRRYMMCLEECWNEF